MTFLVKSILVIQINESALLKICLIMSVTGLVMIYCLVQNVNPKNVHIGELNTGMTGETIKICGSITSKYISKQAVFLEIADESGDIKVVFFEDFAKTSNAYETEENKEVCITGILDTYNEKLEILGRKIGHAEQ